MTAPASQARGIPAHSFGAPKEHAPHAIWYPRTTGIWQTVWMERVAGSGLGGVR
jgi:hypothetical protein